MMRLALELKQEAASFLGMHGKYFNPSAVVEERANESLGCFPAGVLRFSRVCMFGRIGRYSVARGATRKWQKSYMRRLKGLV